MMAVKALLFEIDFLEDVRVRQGVFVDSGPVAGSGIRVFACLRRRQCNHG